MLVQELWFFLLQVKQLYFREFFRFVNHGIIFSGCLTLASKQLLISIG